VEDKEGNMDNRVQTPRFDIGHRVRVILIDEDDDEPIDHLPTDYLEYHGKVGYIAESEVELPNIFRKTRKTQSYNYEVFMVKIGVYLRLPEEHLESAETRRFVM
jgi:hypothetical protein